MVELPGANFVHGTVPAGEFTLDYASAGPEQATATIVSFPGSAGLEMSTAKDVLAQRYRIIEINPPGWGGKNDLNRPMAQSEIGSVLAQAANTLVDGPYYLIGTSMGGANAIYAAAAHPQRVLGIILEGSMAPARPDDLSVAPPPPASEDNSGGPPEYPAPPPHKNKPWATEDFFRAQMANRFNMFRWVQPDILPEDALASVRANATPVLALVGDQDEILQPSQKEAFAQYLPHAQFQLVPEGWHDLQNTVPEAFVAFVDGFVQH